MNCAETEELLTAVADGEASALERAQVERHLEACAACRRALRLARAMKGAIAAVASPRLPPDLRAALAREAGRRAPRPSRGAWTLAAAACLAAAALMASGGREPEETIPVEAMLSAHRDYVRGRSLEGPAVPPEEPREDSDVL